jgi:hypothetical protein
MYTGSLVNTNGYHLTFPSVNTTLTPPGAAPSPQSRNATSLLIEDNVTWLEGAHSITMGASMTSYTVWQKNSTLTPRVAFGLIASDPANAMFNAANFPNISAANLTAAQNLYALLTGRVATITERDRHLRERLFSTSSGTRRPTLRRTLRPGAGPPLRIRERQERHRCPSCSRI